MMLTKLKDLFKRRESVGLPYGLTASQVAALKSLRTYPEWSVYQDLLDLIITIHMEQSLIAPEQRHHLADMVLGLRKAGSVIDEILYQVEQDSEHADRRSSRDRSAKQQRTKLSTFGTGFWSGA